MEPTGAKHTNYYAKDTPEAQIRRNGYRRVRERIAGGRRMYYELAPQEREEINSTAIQMHDLGVDYSTAASAEGSEKRGFVYIIIHPKFPGYVKVGRAFDPVSRLRCYQTGCPRREYQLYSSVYFHDCYQAEVEIHIRLQELSAAGEWYTTSPEYVWEQIQELREVL